MATAANAPRFVWPDDYPWKDDVDDGPDEEAESWGPDHIDVAPLDPIDGEGLGPVRRPRRFRWVAKDEGLIAAGLLDEAELLDEIEAEDEEDVE